MASSLRCMRAFCRRPLGSFDSVHSARVTELTLSTFLPISLHLFCRLPLPPGTMSTLWKADDRFKKTYFTKFPVRGFLVSGESSTHAVTSLQIPFELYSLKLSCHIQCIRGSFSYGQVNLSPFPGACLQKPVLSAVKRDGLVTMWAGMFSP